MDPCITPQAWESSCAVLRHTPSGHWPASSEQDFAEVHPSSQLLVSPDGSIAGQVVRRLTRWSAQQKTCRSSESGAHLGGLPSATLGLDTAVMC